MTLEQKQQQKREGHILTINEAFFAKKLAAEIWKATRFGFPSNALTTPDNPRASENPNSPYNRNGTILETECYPIFIFGNQLKVCFSMKISRDDWFEIARELPKESLIWEYLERPPTGSGKPPNFEHSRNRDQLWAWEEMLKTCIKKGLCKVDIQKTSQV